MYHCGKHWKSSGRKCILNTFFLRKGLEYLLCCAIFLSNLWTGEVSHLPGWVGAGTSPLAPDVILYSGRARLPVALNCGHCLSSACLQTLTAESDSGNPRKKGLHPKIVAGDQWPLHNETKSGPLNRVWGYPGTPIQTALRPTWWVSTSSPRPHPLNSVLRHRPGPGVQAIS